MTLLEITFELQKQLTTEQLRRLGQFANTYGLRRFRTDVENKRLTFDFDASRLKPTEVTQVLARTGIAVVRRVDPLAA